MSYSPAIYSHLPPAFCAAAQAPWMGLGAIYEKTAFEASHVIQITGTRDLFYAPGANSFTSLWSDPQTISEPLFLCDVYELAVGQVRSLVNSNKETRDSALERIDAAFLFLDMPSKLDVASEIMERYRESATQFMRNFQFWALPHAGCVAVGEVFDLLASRLDSEQCQSLSQKVDELLKEGDNTVQDVALTILGSICHKLDGATVSEFLPKVDSALFSDRMKGNDAALRALDRILPCLEKEERVAYAKSVEARYEKMDSKTVQFGAGVFRVLLPHMDEEDMLDLAFSLERRRAQVDLATDEMAIEGALAEFVKCLDQSSCLKLAEHVYEQLESEDMETRASAIELLEVIALGVSGAARLTLVEKIEGMLDDEGLWARSAALDAIYRLFGKIQREARLKRMVKIYEMLGDPEDPIPEKAFDYFESLLTQLGIAENLELLLQITSVGALEDIHIEAVGMICQHIPDEALNGFKSHHIENLKEVVEYYLAGLPLDSIFWSAYLESDVRAEMLHELSELVNQYRCGLLMKRWDIFEHQLAYAGLDSPQGLSFEDFKLWMERKTPRSPFLIEKFKADVAQIQPMHARVDKGKLNEALRPIAAVDDEKALKQYLGTLIKDKGANLRKIRADLETVFPNGFTDLSMEQLQEAAPLLLRSIWDERKNQHVRELITHLAFFIAWYNADNKNLKRRMKAVYDDKSVPSDVLYRGLVAAEEFYRDSLEDVVQAAGGIAKEISHIDRQKHLLAAEIDRVQKIAGMLVEVSFVPSRSQTDQFIGFIYEDCNKDTSTRFEVGSEAVYERDFQTYRNIVGRRLKGGQYVKRANLDGKKVLILGIQPRSSWQVDCGQLLDVIEHRFGEIADREKYDYLLLMKDAHQQSNRKDMLTAIEQRGYSPITFEDSVSGSVFNGNEFLVMWERGGPS